MSETPRNSDGKVIRGAFGQRRAIGPTPQVAASTSVEEDVPRKAWSWLESKKALFVYSVLVLFLGAFTFKAREWVVGRWEHSALVRLSACDTLAQKIEWARSKRWPSSLKSLAGTVFMEAGHETYGEKKFDISAEYYRMAIDNIGDVALRAQAERCYAFTLLRTSRFDEGIEHLKIMADRQDIMPSFKRDILYSLVLLSDRAGDGESSKKYSLKLQEFDMQNHWSDNIRRLKRIQPPTA
jgi:hypothetical protein